MEGRQGSDEFEPLFRSLRLGSFDVGLTCLLCMGQASAVYFNQEVQIMRKLKSVFYLPLVILLCVSIAEATFIKFEIKNASTSRATGFQVMFLSQGLMQNAKLDGVGRQSEFRTVDSYLNHFVWDLGKGVAPGKTLTGRLEFTPERYWENVFDNRFTYADGSEQRGVIPYAGFFIYYTATSDPNKVLATLTIRKNSQAIDDPNVPIVFRKSQVFINNSLGNYKLDKFDRPSGKKVDLPDSFTLGPGEERNFNLGLVDANSYILTRSSIAYESSNEQYELACAHSYVEQLGKDKIAQQHPLTSIRRGLSH
jgi:hypothetical protein